jgi:[glutamine synthetase] adenylyltransferase / [glutamine synthetase]-adenylyl-L-tyrosine phosphorylase
MTVRSFASAVQSAPLLPKGETASAILQAQLFAHLDDGDDRSRLADCCAAHPRLTALLAGVIHHSPFLKRVLRRFPARLLDSLLSDPDTGFDRLLKDVETTAQIPFDDAMVRLRELRLGIALHIALADIGGVWDVDQVVDALSRFADRAVDVALRLALRAAVEADRLTDALVAESPEMSGITVLAMGKHGAGELNYSSDIDLIVLFDPDRLPVATSREPLDVAIRIIKDMVRLLHEQTGGGYVFRTDLRLRPDPASTPIAVPVARAITYYQTVGQNWERAALIKARPIAGDLALGSRVLEELVPFVWRRYFDYAAIADIHAMKRQIHQHKGGAEIAIEGHDVKLGRGGIREIEFFVQTQQLVFGGKKPELRGRKTLSMLDGLCAAGWIGREAVTELQAAYRFLRMVEHRLQMIEDEQTQRLPATPQGIARLAEFCGMTEEAFRATLLAHFRQVERHYGQLFEDAPSLSVGKGNLIFTGTTDDPDTLKTLKAMGFPRPDLVAETVRGWHFGRRPAITTPRAREVLTELVPPLLDALGKSSDPDSAIIALDNAFQGMPAAVELLTILKQNAALRTLFAEILGSAPPLSEIVVRRPHVLDALIDPEFAEPVSESTLAHRFLSRLGKVPDEEDFLDLMRDLVRAERFMVGARLLTSVFDPLEAGAFFSAIASAAIEAALARSMAEMVGRHGSVPGLRMAVVALGKLGGREITMVSDLDLMLVYDITGSATETDGARSIYATEFMARLAQRLITKLTVATKRGGLYDVDMRLRPAGNKGPFAVSLSAFEDYHARDAETWERMVLTRARIVAGDRSLVEPFRAACVVAMARAQHSPRLQTDIAEMRAMIAREKPPKSHWDLKLAQGGLVDIEFVAQFLQLKHGSENSAVFHANTGSALQRLAKAGALAEDDARCLIEAWRMQSALAQMIAICAEAPLDIKATPAPVLKRLAGALALPDFRSLDAALVAIQETAAACVKRLLG